MAQPTNPRTDLVPSTEPFTITPPEIRGFTYVGDLASEFRGRRLTSQAAVALLDDMLAIRELEEMIVALRSGGYEPLGDFAYRGPTHVSIGQEGTAVGSASVLRTTDRITSSHRGHGDAIAKGFSAIRSMDEGSLRRRIPGATGRGVEALREAALEDHVFRTIAELFGKDAGYNRGRGGGMHIADFSTGQLGANAIVGGSVPIATGASMALRYLGSDDIVCCFAGDGAYANGVVLESLNWAAQHQWSNFVAGDDAYGLPIIFLVQNNHYGMTGRSDDEVMGVPWLAQRAVGFSDDGMHAEVVDGMNVLAVRDAVLRAAERCRSGRGPAFIESSTYRYYGHSLSDPRNEYRSKDEEAAWKAIDPILRLSAQLVSERVLDAAGVAEVERQAAARNARAAVRAAEAADPDPGDVLTFVLAGTSRGKVPAEHASPAMVGEPPVPKVNADGMLYKDALRQGLVEEMQRDARVIFYGEDVAEYGGAFKASKGLLEAFGRSRVFNTPISEAAICGTAVGAAMAGLRPVVELMYMDFALMASDQIANQAAKWHFMSGAQTTVPLVIRASVGAGKGYGGQHSQSLESLFTHLPGLVVLYPSTAADAKGMLKAAIRSDDPVLFCESQGLYATRGPVSDDADLIVPIGKARVARTGSDATIVAWGPAVPDAMAAADVLAEGGVEAEVIDLRSLVPLDIDTVITSVRKTGRCVVASQAVLSGSYVNEIVARVMEEAFDDLDGPVARIGARNGISPQAEGLEAAYLPHPADIVAAVEGLI